MRCGLCLIVSGDTTENRDGLIKYRDSYMYYLSQWEYTLGESSAALCDMVSISISVLTS